MKMEDYMNLLKIKFEGKEIFNKDENRIMSWEEVAEDFITYEDYENESIIDYVYNLTDRNSNCEFK